MKKNDVFILEERGVLYINGEDAEPFLQNLISNDVKKVNETNTCFASLLTPQGKYLFEFIIAKHKKGYFIECEKKIIDELFMKLNSYKFRSKIDILNLSNEFVVAVISREKFLTLNNSKDLVGHTIKFREDLIYLDPRHKNLGARLIINLEKLHLSLKMLELKSSNIEEYYAISSNLGIPQTSTDKLQNNLFGIECNLNELNGIDFKKGCYVGQENTARIKLKNKLSKRLFPVEVIEGNLSKENLIKYEEYELGKILINDQFPFAIIKFKDKKFKFNKTYKCGSAYVRIKQPSWFK
mgnify:CR=1 FL=1|tara:strand:+ start:598 stop:1485 length:888 start_codon:yes stop_codon:yes gene_type:complete